MNYFARRVLVSVGQLWFLSVVAFLFLDLVPGDYYLPSIVQLHASPGAVDLWRAQHGLNLPWTTRYANWVGSALHGEFGRSLAYEMPVCRSFVRGWRRRCRLSCPLALLVCWFAGAGLALAAVRKGRRAIAAIELGAVLISLLPDVIGVSLLMWLAVGLKVQSIATAWLPMLALTLALLPVVVLHATNAMSDAARLPFVRLAERRGIGTGRLWRSYVMPAAANPLTSLAGLSLAGAIGTSLLVEVLLGWPGLGPLFLEAAQTRDYPVVTTVVVLLGSVLTLESAGGPGALPPRSAHPAEPMKAGATLLLLLAILPLIAALAADWIAPYDPVYQDRAAASAPPSHTHWLGTDEYGRDLWSRYLHGTRWSVSVGLCAAALVLLLGWTIGGIAGFQGGWVDWLAMHAAELFLVIPWLYLLIAVRAALPLNLAPRRAFAVLLFAIALTGWARPARLVRGMVLSLRRKEYVEAALGFGANGIATFFRHVAPSTYGLLATQALLLVPQFVLAEVTLSYMGLGLGEPEPSMGQPDSSPQTGLPVERRVVAGAAAAAHDSILRRTIGTGPDAGAQVFRLVLLRNGVYRILLNMVCRCLTVLVCLASSLFASTAGPVRGGTLHVVERAEPKTLNPAILMDNPSRAIAGRINADLIAVDHITQKTVPSLAESWTRTPDGRTYTLKLRRGVRFSDGHPFTADDVVFSFAVYLDPKVNSPQRDLLLIDEQPMQVVKRDDLTVDVHLPAPYAAAERLFDSAAMLPKHKLEAAWRAGKLRDAWSLATPPAEIVGLGPFRLREYRPGEAIVLERNPYYWKRAPDGGSLPYLDAIEVRFTGDEDGQLARFASGELDVINRVTPKSIPFLKARGAVVTDLGPGLDYNFLCFNLSPGSPKLKWFEKTEFREALSLAIDREGMSRLVYEGRAEPIWGSVTPGNREWFTASLPRPKRSVAEARNRLRAAGFSWNAQADLVDAAGSAVEFSLLVSSSSADRNRMATVLQADFRELGIRMTITPLEFRSMLDRVLNTRQFDTCLMGLGGGSPDPNAELNVWLSSGAMHLWNPGQPKPSSPWEAAIDALMKRQAKELDPAKRKSLYTQVQEIVAREAPLIFLVSPNVVSAAQKTVANFRPSTLEHLTLWNADQLYLLPRQARP